MQESEKVVTHKPCPLCGTIEPVCQYEFQPGFFCHHPVQRHDDALLAHDYVAPESERDCCDLIAGAVDGMLSDEFLEKLAAERDALKAEETRLRARMFGGSRSTRSDHKTACTIWGDDGRGGTREGFKEPLPCNCGALENFLRSRVWTILARVNTLIELRPPEHDTFVALRLIADDLAAVIGGKA